MAKRTLLGALIGSTARRGTSLSEALGIQRPTVSRVSGAAASFGGGRVSPARKAFEDFTPDARRAEITSFRGSVSNLSSERLSLQAQSIALNAEARRLQTLQSSIERRQTSLVQRGTVGTNRLVNEFNTKSRVFNTKAEALGKKVEAFNVKASTTFTKGSELNISLSAKEQIAVSRVDKPFVKKFVVTPDPASRLAPFGLEARQTRIEIERRKREAKAFRERPTPKPIGLKPIKDFPKFVQERSAEIRAGGEKLFKTAIFEQLTFLKPKKSEIDLKKTERRLEAALAALDIGTGAAGLGFVAIGEPIIGGLPSKPIKFVDPFGTERELTKGGFRSSLDIAGQLAFIPAVVTAPGAIKALPKAISATKLELADFSQMGELGIFKKKGIKVKTKKGFDALELPKIPSIKAGDIPGTFTVKEPKLFVFAKPTKGRFTIKEPKVFTFVKPTKGTFIVKEPKVFRFTAPISKPQKPLTFIEKEFVKSLKPAVGKRSVTIQLTKPKTTLNDIFKTKLPTIKQAPPTTAGLRTTPQLSFKEFTKQVKAIEVFAKPTVAKKFIGIPGSAKALAFGLPLRPKGKVIEEIQFGRIGIQTGKLLGIKTSIITTQRQKIQQTPAFKMLAIPKISQLIKAQTRVSQKTIQLTFPKITELELTLEGVKIAELQKPKQRTIQRVIQRTITVPKILIPTLDIAKIPKEVLKTQKLPPFGIQFPKPRKRKKKEKRKQQQAFASFVKMKGEMVKVSKKPLFKTTARALAMFVVDKSASRTGTIRPISGTPRGLRLPSPSSRKFRKPIKGGRINLASNLFIEKTKFAIDSPGERKQITQKGLEALRMGFFKKRKKRKTKTKRKRR